MYEKYILVDLLKYRNLIIWRFVEIKNNILYLEGEDRFWMKRDKYFYFCQIGNKKFYPKYYYYSGFDFVTMYGISIKGRVICFEINLEPKIQQDLHFFISYMNYTLEIYPIIGNSNHLPSLQNSYYSTEDYIILNKINNLVLFPYTRQLEEILEINYCNELKQKKKNNIVKLRHLRNNNEKNNKKDNQVWLINDRINKAGDNGEYFFRFLNRIKPIGISFYFVIIKNCSDFKRLKIYNNIIEYNSSEYINLFFKTKKIFTSVSETWVSNPFDEDGKYICDYFKFDLIYLQNGIIKDDLSLYLNKITQRFNILLTSSIKEYKFLLTPNYGYNSNNLLLTGLPRFDSLIRLKKVIKKEKIILIFPTWRIYIKGTKNLLTKESIKSENFQLTKYFNYYNDLINNEKLLDIMEKNEYRGILCIHPNFEEEWTYFRKNKLFEVEKNCFRQELFVKASLLVTDYSSIFFDFGYIRTPIIYTQFDYEEYRRNHFSNGYFNYKTDSFGPICYDNKSTINTIISEIENNCLLKQKYLKRMEKFFRYNDDKNCYRFYTGILKSDSKIGGKLFPKIDCVFFFIILIELISKLLNYIYYY